MKIFPLSVPAKVVLVLIAIVIGLIWSMLQWPDKWRWFLKKEKIARIEQKVKAAKDARDAKRK